MRKVDQSIESKIGIIRKKFRETFNLDYENDLHVMWTFEDAVIVGDYSDSGLLYEFPYKKQGDEIIFGEPLEVEQIMVLKRLVEDEVSSKDIADVIALMAKKVSEPELTGPIVFKNSPEKIAYAAVLVPGELDHDGESVTAEKVEQSAHEWMEGYANVDLMHTLNNVAVPVESYILPMDMDVEAYGKKMSLPKGTWILASKVKDDDVWEKVEKGEYTGYSVMGIRRAALKDLVGKAKDGALKDFEASLKKTLLRDLGPDWVAAFVSIVDEPAVPKAKFFALKRGDDGTKSENPELDQEKKGGFISKLFGAGKSGRRFSDATYTQLKKTTEALGELLKEAEKERQGTKNKLAREDDIDMNQEELVNVVNEAVKTAIKPLQDEIEVLKKAVEPDGSGGSGDDESQKGKGSDGDQESGEESFEEKVSKRLEALEKSVKKGNTSSKAVKGQDGDGIEEEDVSVEDDGRDLYGRKRKEVGK